MTRNTDESAQTQGFNGGDLIECSECGHEHFNAKQRRYVPCPLLAEGCTCPMSPRSGGRT